MMLAVECDLLPNDLEKLLRRHGVAVKAAGPGMWEVTLAAGGDNNGGGTVRGCAAVRGGWMVIEAPVPNGRLGAARSNDLPCRLLAANGRLPPGVKLCCLPGQRRPVVRVEQAATRRRADLQSRLPTLLRDLVEVHNRYSELLADGGLGASPPGPGADGGEGLDLTELCRGAGWRYVERTGELLAVELELPRGQFNQALVSRRGDGAVHLAVELASCLERWSAACRRALGLLLLEASAAVRLVRAVGGPASSVWAGFEVLLGAPVRPRDLDAALCACSVAARLCGREAELFSDEALAGCYLSMRGWSS